MYPKAHVRPVMDARNTQKKPYDSYMLFKSKFYAFEFKEIKGLSINPDILKSHQIDGLREVERNGGHGYVVIFTTKDSSVCMVFALGEWLSIFDYDYDGVLWKSGKSSIKVNVFEEEFGMTRIQQETKNGKKTLWDFNTICQ